MAPFEELSGPISTLFGITNFREYQVEGIKSILDGKDVFVCQPTGSGKSIIFQSIPFFYGNVVEAPPSSEKVFAHGSDSTVWISCEKCVLVISPLVSLMMDQIKDLGSKGIKSLCIRNDNENPTDIEVRRYVII